LLCARLPEPSSSPRLLLPLCHALGRRASGGAALLVSGLWADDFSPGGRAAALQAFGGIAGPNFFRCTGGDRFRSRPSAWRARSRMSASGMDSLPDQSLNVTRSLWSVDSERDFWCGATVGTDASGQRNTGRHFGVPGSKSQHLAFGRLPLPAVAVLAVDCAGADFDPGFGPPIPHKGLFFGWPLCAQGSGHELKIISRSSRGLGFGAF